MKQIKRWALMNKVFMVSLGLIVLFAWMDAQQIRFVKTIDELWQRGDILWTRYWDIQLPAVVTMWYGVLLAIGIIWYLYSKDKSEALAMFLAPAILIFMGTQDLLYYVFSTDILSVSVDCWADRMLPIRIISDLFRETCPTAFSFILSGFLGIPLSYKVYKYLQVSKW